VTKCGQRCAGKLILSKVGIRFRDAMWICNVSEEYTASVISAYMEVISFREILST
jgi:hypothetical protein